MKEPNLTSEELRHAFAALADTAAPQPGCPEPGRILDAAQGSLSVEEASGIIDHTSRCFVCAETWRLAHEMDTSGQLAMKTARRATGHSSMIWLAAAAAVTVTVGIGVFIVPLKQDTAPVMREGEEPEIRSLVPESGALPRGACVLRWSAVEAGAKYAVQVGTDDLTRVAEARDLNEPGYTVPAAALEALPDGAALLWRVEATLPDGRRIASVTFINRLQ